MWPTPHKLIPTHLNEATLRLCHTLHIWSIWTQQTEKGLASTELSVFMNTCEESVSGLKKDAHFHARLSLSPPVFLFVCIIAPCTYSYLSVMFIFHFCFFFVYNHDGACVCVRVGFACFLCSFPLVDG